MQTDSDRKQVEKTQSNKSLYQRLTELRWPIFIIVVGAAAVHQAILFVVLRVSPPPQESLLQLVLYSLTGIVVAWFGLRQLNKTAARREETESELRKAYDDLERTHRQLQTIHEVSRRVANALDLQELLGIAARIPVDLLGAKATTVITFDEHSSRGDLEVTWGLDGDQVQALRHEVETSFSSDRCLQCQPLTAHVDQNCPLLTPLRSSNGGQTSGTSRPIAQHPERSEWIAQHPWEPPLRSTPERQRKGRSESGRGGGLPEWTGGIGQIVCLPLGRGQRRSGVVAAYMDGSVTLSDEETQLISIVAAEITAAMESARLRTRQMATLYAVDQATQERRGLDSLLERVLQTTMDGWNVDAGAILLAGESGDSWSIRAHQGMGDALSAPAFGPALRLAEKARSTGQPLILQERDSQPGIEGAGQPVLASIAIILLHTEGQTLGALFLGSSQPGYFKPAQSELMKAIGSQIALAVRNAQLYLQLRETAVLEERYRLSREMHDGVAQSLGYLGMQAERLEQLLDRDDPDLLRQELKGLRGVIADVYLDVREAIDGLRLTVDRPDGFVGALRSHVEDFSRRSGLPIDCSGVASPGDLPPDVALHMLRVAQEALTNIRRHAGARQVWVSLIRENGHLELTVADDGQGFDPADPRDRHHVGLSSMRERVRSLNGQLTLASSPGRGTRMTARVPLE